MLVGHFELNLQRRPIWAQFGPKIRRGAGPPRPLAWIRHWRFIFAVTSFSGRGRCYSYLGVPMCRVSPLDPLGKGYPKH